MRAVAARIWQRRSRASVTTLVGLAAAVIMFAVLAWERRWISDDGLIFVRVARQILAGNGPVFNDFERVETTTSVLWTWLLAGAGIFGSDRLPLAAVVLGWVLSVAGVALAVDATRRWHRARGVVGPLLPFAVMIVIGAFPFRDFATSGLETGLTTAWLGATWWLLVALRADTSRRRLIAIAIVFGLGPLIRPDLAIHSTVFLATAWAVVRLNRRRTIALAALALALPFVYEIFRAGYYGMLVPTPALAKSAATAEWARGGRYLWHFVDDCSLWIPFGLAAAGAVYAIAKRTIDRSAVIVGAAPVIAGVLGLTYMIRVGGDFMYGRLVLPALFTLAMPAFAIPASRRALVGVAGMIAWTAWIGTTVTVGPIYWGGLREWDERISYIQRTRDVNPIYAAEFVHRSRAAQRYEFAIHHRESPVFIHDQNGGAIPLDPAIDAPVAAIYGTLGTGGAALPLDGIVADIFGLASPLGARITRTEPGKIGHEKRLPVAWQLVQFADPRFVDEHSYELDSSPEEIRAARHVVACDDVAELFDAVRADLTVTRFWHNLTGALHRTRLVIPANPIEAERALCK